MELLFRSIVITLFAPKSMLIAFVLLSTGQVFTTFAVYTLVFALQL